MVIGIIGGGAAGMAAALAAAQCPGCQVVVLERQARVGRKLQATGNGRCNLTNMHALFGGYHGQQAEFAKPALEAFSPEDTRKWFRSMGLFTVEEPGGRVYPYSDQANSVVDVLRFAMQKENIQLVTGFEVSKLKHGPEGFLVGNAEQIYRFDKLIIACGGLAGTKLGGSMSGYKLLSRMGHKVSKLRPTLVQLKTSWPAVTALKGVRANAHVQILRDGEVFAQSTGELQFTEYGFSGPVIFEVSRDVCQGPGEWLCRMDFLPEIGEAELLEELKRRRSTNLTVEDLLTGILHNRLGRVLTKAAGLDANAPISRLAEAELRAVCACVKRFEAVLTEPMGMDSAQVTAGGVLTEDFDPYTMESKLVPGLYACGEVLDIDGDCGGYNLQWAWSSGRMAGLHAGKETT